MLTYLFSFATILNMFWNCWVCFWNFVGTVGELFSDLMGNCFGPVSELVQNCFGKFSKLGSELINTQQKMCWLHYLFRGQEKNKPPKKHPWSLLRGGIEGGRGGGGETKKWKQCTFPSLFPLFKKPIKTLSFLFKTVYIPLYHPLLRLHIKLFQN